MIVDLGRQVVRSMVWTSDPRFALGGLTGRRLNGTNERHVLTTISDMSDVLLHENMVTDTFNLVKSYGLYLNGLVIKYADGKPHAGVLGGADAMVRNSDGTYTFTRTDGLIFRSSGNYGGNSLQSDITLWRRGLRSAEQLFANVVSNVTNCLGMRIVDFDTGRYACDGGVETQTIQEVVAEANRAALNGTPDSRFSVKTEHTLHLFAVPQGTTMDAALMRRFADWVAAYDPKVQASTNRDGAGPLMTAPPVNPGAILLEGVTLQPVS